MGRCVGGLLWRVRRKHCDLTEHRMGGSLSLSQFLHTNYFVAEKARDVRNRMLLFFFGMKEQLREINVLLINCQDRSLSLSSMCQCGSVEDIADLEFKIDSYSRRVTRLLLSFGYKMTYKLKIK